MQPKVKWIGSPSEDAIYLQRDDSLVAINRPTLVAILMTAASFGWKTPEGMFDTQGGFRIIHGQSIESEDAAHLVAVLKIREASLAVRQRAEAGPINEFLTYCAQGGFTTLRHVAPQPENSQVHEARSPAPPAGDEGARSPRPRTGGLVLVALIAAATVLASVGMYLYFSPYQSCVRGLQSDGVAQKRAHSHCAEQLGGRSRSSD